MKVLIIGGNRFVGLNLSLLLEQKGVELHILNRTGQAPHAKAAVVHKGDRRNLSFHALDQDWDVIYDFACFTQSEAEAASRFFNRVGRYIFISTAMVYEFGKGRRELDFVAKNFNLTAPRPTDPEALYPDGKRRAEAVFAAQNRFPVVSVRFPLLLGPDDYTHRLEFHVERVRRGEALYLPNRQAELSLLESADAASFLSWAMDKDFYGAVNVASPDAITLGGLIAQVETATGREAKLATKANAENQSPYAFPSDLSLNVSALTGLGYRARALNAWLPELIRSLAGSGAGGGHVLH